MTQWLQPVQDKACHLFTEVERWGEELEQVVSIVEQRLEGPVNDALIQEFTEQEVVAQQQVEEAQAKLEAFEADLPRSEWLGTSHSWVLALYWPLTKIWRTLVTFDQFWDFDRLVEGRAQGKAEIAGSWPLIREFLGFGFM